MSRVGSGIQTDCATAAARPEPREGHGHRSEAPEDLRPGHLAADLVDLAQRLAKFHGHPPPPDPPDTRTFDPTLQGKGWCECQVKGRRDSDPADADSHAETETGDVPSAKGDRLARQDPPSRAVRSPAEPILTPTICWTISRRPPGSRPARPSAPRRSPELPAPVATHRDHPALQSRRSPIRKRLRMLDRMKTSLA